jgi:hypothetical protein
VPNLGSFSDGLARLLGWSPIGRTLVLRGAEGPHAAAFEGMTGRVTALSDGVLLLEGRLPGPPGSGTTVRARLTPRHAGWTAHALMLAPIAVVAELPAADGQPVRSAVAIASRQSGRPD